MCEHCKVAYSFFFGVQYHKVDCPVIVEAESMNGRVVFATTSLEMSEANPMSREDFLASGHGK